MNYYPLVSVIILNFNGTPFLKDCIQSIYDLNYPAEKIEIIMGDNASTDDSVRYVEDNFKRVRVVSFDDNYGFCKPNNICAALAKGEYLVFLNNDTFVERDWLLNMIKAIQHEEHVVSCACKIYLTDSKESKLLNAAGGVIFPSGSGLYEGWVSRDYGGYDDQKYTAFGCGAGFLIKRDFFIGTGGFDEYYFYSGEEMDLGFRAWLCGFKVLYVPSAVMHHHMGRTGFRHRSRSPTIEFLVMRNKLYFILKNFNLSNVVKGIVLYALEAKYKIFYSLLHGNIHIPASILKAYIHIIKDLGRILKNRSMTQGLRVVSDSDLQKSGIIISVKEEIRRYVKAKKDMEAYSGDIFDKKDAVKIRLTKKGEFVFFMV